MLELSDKELDVLMPFYTDTVPLDLSKINLTIMALHTKGLLDVHIKDDIYRLLHGTAPYYVEITPRGFDAVQAQEPLRLALACISCGATSEALVFMRYLLDEELVELLVCSSEVIRRQAKRRLEVSHATI